MSFIEVKNVTKTFNGVEILKNLNMTIDEGIIDQIQVKFCTPLQFVQIVSGWSHLQQQVSCVVVDVVVSLSLE